MKIIARQEQAVLLLVSGAPPDLLAVVRLARLDRRTLSPEMHLGSVLAHSFEAWEPAADAPEEVREILAICTEIETPKGARPMV